MELLLIFFLLFTKHFIVDFPLQNKFQYENKGKYGHLGGILHAWCHGFGTYLIFLWFTNFAIIYAIIDMILHYHIDWLKVNINKILGYRPNTHEQFWWLLGLDQYLHYLTYLGLVALHFTKG